MALTMQINRAEKSRELALVLSIFGLALITNFLTAGLSPTVWMDEVMFTDPAVNLRLFGHFTSSAWPAVPDQNFWAGYPPLYPLLLSAWLWFAPITPTGVRSLNFVLIILACFALWYAVLRSGLIRSRRPRLLLLLLILCGYCTSYSYRSGRPDTLGILIIGLLVVAVVSDRSTIRAAAIFVLGGLLPWAGLQFVVYVGILMGLALLVTQSLSTVSIWLTGGIITGLIGLVTLYYITGSLNFFLASVLPHTILAGGGANEGFGLLTGIFSFFRTDFSFVLMLPVLIANVVMLFHRKREDRQIHLFLVLTVVATPPIMFVLGKFPVYYFWMSFIPMCFLAVLTVDRALPFVERSFSKYFAFVTVSLVCATIIIGLPARTVIALVEADKRDYAKVSTYIASALNSDDIAFVDFSAYYPAKLHAKKVYLPEYLNIMSAAERRSVSVAIIRDPATDPEKFVATEFGGNWKKSAADYTEGTDRDWLGLVKLAAPYHFAVLRRTTAPVHRPLSRESQ